MVSASGNIETSRMAIFWAAGVEPHASQLLLSESQVGDEGEGFALVEIEEGPSKLGPYKKAPNKT